MSADVYTRLHGPHGWAGPSHSGFLIEGGQKTDLLSTSLDVNNTARCGFVYVLWVSRPFSCHRRCLKGLSFGWPTFCGRLRLFLRPERCLERLSFGHLELGSRTGRVPSTHVVTHLAQRPVGHRTTFAQSVRAADQALLYGRSMYRRQPLCCHPIACTPQATMHVQWCTTTRATEAQIGVNKTDSEMTVANCFEGFVGLLRESPRQTGLDERPCDSLNTLVTTTSRPQ